MTDGYKIVAVTFAGRRATMPLLERLLCPHAPGGSGLINEWLLGWNVRDPADAPHVRRLAEELPWARVVEKAPGAHNFCDFYPHLQDPRAIYLKLDDDVIWAEPGAIPRLLRFRVEHPEYSLVSANVVNNLPLTWLHQHLGVLDQRARVGWDPFDPLAWGSGPFAEHVHRRLIASARAGELGRWKFDRFLMDPRERFSINCVSFFGSDLARAGRFFGNDEIYLSTEFGRRIGKQAAYCGQALVSHYSFGPQHAHLERTDVLEQYRRLAEETPA